MSKKKFPDQTVLLSGYVILSIACLIGVIILPLSEPGSQKYLPAFLVFVILDVFSLPLIVVTTTSLFTKETNDDHQGIGQGIQRAVVNIAAVIGPLYAGCLIDHMWSMILSQFTIVVIATILIILVYRKFKPETTDELTALIPPVNNNNNNN
jgi:predicted MFS family arabinose efflux permease